MPPHFWASRGSHEPKHFRALPNTADRMVSTVLKCIGAPLVSQALPCPSPGGFSSPCHPLLPGLPGHLAAFPWKVYQGLGPTPLLASWAQAVFLRPPEGALVWPGDSRASPDPPWKEQSQTARWASPSSTMPGSHVHMSTHSQCPGLVCSVHMGCCFSAGKQGSLLRAECVHYGLDVCPPKFKC